MSPILGIWASAQQGQFLTAFNSIATTTVGSGGASSIEFTSIPGTYKHLQIRIIARDNRATTGDYAALQFNNDTGANYAEHSLYGNGTSASAAATASGTYMGINRFAGGSAGANTFGVSIIDILDYANTNKYKTTRNLGGYDNNGDGRVGIDSGLWMNTNAITSIKLSAQAGSSNFTQYSSFALYGIK